MRFSVHQDLRAATLVLSRISRELSDHGSVTRSIDGNVSPEAQEISEVHRM